MKKLKESDGPAISMGNVNAHSGEHGTDNRLLDRFVDVHGPQFLFHCLDLL